MYNRQKIDDYYNKIIGAIDSACRAAIPHCFRRHGDKENVVAGWNDIVKDKHGAARAAFLDWVANGRPRGGPLFTIMARIRAAFKLALRYCRDRDCMLML